MKFLPKIAASVGLTLALATVSFAQQVKTDYDHNANFGQYKTYSWEKVQTKDPLMVDRIKSAVNSALTAKGWTVQCDHEGLLFATDDDGHAYVVGLHRGKTIALRVGGE